MWWRSRVEEKLDALVELQFAWRKKDMANWNDIKNSIHELKEETVKVLATLDMVRTMLKECQMKDHIEAKDLDEAHAALEGVIGDMEAKVHADGM